eukprot:jgi/Mesvir1/5129/Mv15281-RA.2
MRGGTAALSRRAISHVFSSTRGVSTVWRLAARLHQVQYPAASKFQVQEGDGSLYPFQLRGFRSTPSSASSGVADMVPVESGDKPTDAEAPRPGFSERDTSWMTPAVVVEQLSRFIVGQEEAKRAVAVALRNRWRRHRVDAAMKEEIVPKNILMIGPTGCGKTEIARRLAKLADAPFIKVEATKFTEVGFHGRDCDQIIRDLVDSAISLMKQKMRTQIKKQVDDLVENRILDILCGEASEVRADQRETFRQMYRSGQLDERRVDVDLPEGRGGRIPIDMGSTVNISDVLIRVQGALGRGRREKRTMRVADCKPLFEDAEVERLLSPEAIAKDAITAVEQDGIVFIDEIDKIVTTAQNRIGADASAEGVQRDLLPIIEGSVISTKYGNVSTDHILFIASGAFHSCRPSDMLAELQGRLPIRVELQGLTRNDLYRILTEPEMNMIKQQRALLKTEDVELVFTDCAIQEIASITAEVNRTVENMGARRLYTVIEKVLEDVSFNAPQYAGQEYIVNGEVSLISTSSVQ